jgi:uncharacterized protein YceH (UPF0502 family)
MTTLPEAGYEPATTAWPVLDMDERRVLGVLAEKGKTTPDVYPMSINALVAGCNQKSNRDPVMNLTDADVETALVKAQKKGLTFKVTGGRVIRWRHALYEAWQLNKVELAVLAELLLRGPQTEGELRARANRMDPIEDLDGLRSVLRPLAERRLVVYLSPEGKRGTVLTHGFHAPEELQHLRVEHVGRVAIIEEESLPVTPDRAAAPDQPGWEARLAEVLAEIAALRTMVTALQADLATVREQVRSLREALGM